MQKLDRTKFKQTELGPIPEEWNIFTIQDVSEVIGGGTPSTEDQENFNGNIAWITPRDLSIYKERYIFCGERNISDKGLSSSNAKLIPKNSVLLTTRAPVGYLAISKNEMTTNQGFHSMVPNEKTSSIFLYYLLKNNVQKLVENASGSTFQELNGKTLKSLTFAFPTINEQSRIATILSSLDDKIELNRQMNVTLEKIASALFKRWFVDVDSKYTRLGTLSEICEFNPTYKLQKNTATKYVEMKNLSEASLSMDFAERVFTSGSKFMNRDTLLARITPCLENGKTGFVDFLGSQEVGWGSTEFIIMHPKKEEYAELLYILARSNDFRDYAVQSMSGTSGRQRVSVDALKDFELLIPDDDVLKKFHVAVKSLFSRILLNHQENQRLVKVRDSLLPRLMSGRIRV